MVARTTFLKRRAPQQDASAHLRPMGGDSPVEVHFHQHPDALAQWCQGMRTDMSVTNNTTRAVSDPASGRRKVSSASAPLPRLNIAIHITGSRGDVQPFIPIAQLLAGPRYGHRVRISTHPCFKDFVESQGVEFFSIGGDPEALMAYMVKNPGLMPSGASLKAGDVTKRRKDMVGYHARLLAELYRGGRRYDRGPPDGSYG